MSRKHAIFLPLAFLSACATAAKPSAAARDSARPPEPPAATSAPAAALKPDAGVEKSYRSALPICFDAALKVCRERDCVVRKQDRQGDESGLIAAQGRSFEFTLTFSRSPDRRTRVKLIVQGDNRDEAARFLDGLGQALLEPRD
jgi:hypothetical protein